MQWPEDDHELPSYSFLHDPAGWTARAQGFRQRGLRVILGVGYEGARQAWARDRHEFVLRFGDFLSRVPLGVISSVFLGPEIEEYFGWDLPHDLLALCEAHRLPSAVHFGATVWGPSGPSPDPSHHTPAEVQKYRWRSQELGWWTEARRRAPSIPLACAFQHRNYDTPSARRNNAAFLSPDWDVVGPESHTEALLQPSRLPSQGIELIVGEIAWNGTDPHAVVVPEDESRELGRAALAWSVNGRTPIGAINGC